MINELDDELLLDFANEANTIEQEIETAKRRFAYHDERKEAWAKRLDKLTRVLTIIRNVEVQND